MTEPRSILLVTSNGFGMGHLVRQLAVAAALPADVRCTILTLSQAAPVAARTGVRLEYCPSYTSPWISKRAWHRGYLRERIIALAQEVAADVVAFDGVVPYIGLLNALEALDVTRVWFRRGVWRDSADPAPLDYSSFFDCIIEPGDLGATRDVGPTAAREDAVHVGVITQAGPAALLDRVAAAAALGVDPERPTLLFNVGSNAIPGLAELMEAIAEDSDWNVVTTKDALGRNRSGAASRVLQVQGIFPLYPYLSAVDLAVTSVGYNAAHEFVGAHVPTVLVPADNVTDDQRARANAIADADAGVVVEAEDIDRLQAQLQWLMDSEIDRGALALGAKELQEGWTDGAQAAAALLCSLPAGTAQPTTFARFKQRARNLAEIALSVRDRRSPQPYVLTEDLLGADLRGDVAIEHVLPGTSPEYREHRRVIAERYLG